MGERWSFSCRAGITLVLRDRSPSTATEPLPRDGGVRGWRMARLVFVARDASKQDALQYNYKRHPSVSSFRGKVGWVGLGVGGGGESGRRKGGSTERKWRVGLLPKAKRRDL